MINSQKGLVNSGVDAVEYMLDEAYTKISPLNTEKLFFEWACEAVRKKSQFDKEYVAKVEVKLTKKKYAAELRNLKTAFDLAFTDWKSVHLTSIGAADRHSIIFRYIDGLTKAIDGMQAKLNGQIEEDESLILRLILKKKELENLIIERDQLEECNQYKMYKKCEIEKETFESLILSPVETKLKHIQQSTGNRARSSGFNFEDFSEDIVKVCIRCLSFYLLPLKVPFDANTYAIYTIRIGLFLSYR